MRSSSHGSSSIRVQTTEMCAALGAARALLRNSAQTP